MRIPIQAGDRVALDPLAVMATAAMPPAPIAPHPVVVVVRENPRRHGSMRLVVQAGNLLVMFGD